MTDAAYYRAALAALADSPEPDPSEPVAAEPGVPLAEPHRQDLDVMGHS